MEEMLRYESPVQVISRLVIQDVTVGKVELKSGDRILVYLGSANRDAEVFHDAETFVVDRQENRHVAFGGGKHFCVGAALARLEARCFSCPARCSAGDELR